MCPRYSYHHSVVLRSETERISVLDLERDINLADSSDNDGGGRRDWPPRVFRDHPEMYLNHWSDEDEMRSPPNPAPAPAGWPLMVPPPPHGGAAQHHDHHHGAAGHHQPGNVMVLAMEDDQESDHEVAVPNDVIINDVLEDVLM